MKITIVTLTVNNAEELRKTLTSIYNQSYTDIESIVVDGNSTDNTDQVMAEFPNSKHIKSEPRGVYNAINVGTQYATGDIIGILHTGDTFTNHDVLEEVAKAFADDRLDFIFGDISYVTHSGRIVRNYSASDFTVAQLKKGIAPPHPSLYMKLKIAKMQTFRYNESYRIAGDFDLFIRLLHEKRLLWRYLPIDMVMMNNDGVSSKWINRLNINTKEKHRALKENGYNVSYFKLFGRFIHNIKGYFTIKRSK